MRHYGLIGNPVEHSFSARYFAEKFRSESIDAAYELYPCERIEQAQRILQDLDGCNITIPYKEAIIPYLERIDETAAAIGAVNVIKNGKGYNTDYIGFMESIRAHLRESDQFALILGTGGASKAVHYGLKQLGLEVTFVSRTPREGQLGYPQLNKEIMQKHTVVVNCTPLGMWPNIDDAPNIPYEELTPQHLLFDCIYNPEETQFLQSGKRAGCRTINGMPMLIKQAEAAWQIWN